MLFHVSTKDTVNMENQKSQNANLLCPFERTSPRMEDVALQQLKAKQCVVWLRDRLTTESVKHSTRPKAYRVDSSRGSRSNLTRDSLRSNLKINRDTMDCRHQQNDKTIGARLMEGLIVDGYGVKFYHKKSSPISYTRIWTKPVNPKGKAGVPKRQPISSSLFAVTCFLKLRQTTAAQKASQRGARNQSLVKNHDRGLKNRKLLISKVTTEREKINQKGEINDESERELGASTKDCLLTPEMQRRQRVSKNHFSVLKYIQYHP